MCLSIGSTQQFSSTGTKSLTRSRGKVYWGQAVECFECWEVFYLAEFASQLVFGIYMYISFSRKWFEVSDISLQVGGTRLYAGKWFEQSLDRNMHLGTPT